MAKALTKKQLRSKIFERLLTSFEGLKVNVNEKKLKKHAKEASKLLMIGVKLKAQKNGTPQTKVAKKAKAR